MSEANVELIRSIYEGWVRGVDRRHDLEKGVSDREGAFSYIRSHPDEVLTGVIYADESVPDMHEMNNTPETALSKVPMDKLCPGSAALAGVVGTVNGEGGECAEQSPALNGAAEDELMAPPPVIGAGAIRRISAAEI